MITFNAVLSCPRNSYYSRTASKLSYGYRRLIDRKSESFLTEAHPNPQKRALVFLKALA